MSSIRIGVVGVVIGLGVGLTACRGVVAPGRTAGDTYGGAYSARFAPKEEPKKEKKDEKVEAKRDDKPKVAAVEPGTYDRPGFITRQKDGRIWAFRTGSKELGEFLKGGEPTKSATLVGVGPGGMTVRGPDVETVEAYAAARPGYEVWVVDARYWVFKEGGKDAQEFAQTKDLAKNVTLVGAGPGGRTLRASDMETAEGYVKALDR